MTKQQFEKIFAAVENKAKALGCSNYELYYSGSESVSAETFKDELSGFSAGKDGGLILRLEKDGKTGAASCSGASEKEAARLVDEALENALLIEKEEKTIFCEGGQTYKELPPCTYTLPSAKAVKDTAMKMRHAAYASSKLISEGTSGGAYASKSETYLYSGKGLRLSSETGGEGAYIYSVLEKGKEKRDAFDVANKPFGEIDEKKLAKTATDKARERFGAKVPASGTYPVVFEGKQMQQILGTFLSVFFAKEVQQGMSLLKGKEGKKIATKKLTIIDDPFFPGNTMQCAFDGEGSPTFTKAVIEKGVLKTFLYNLESAAKAGKQTTGNGGRGASSIGTRVFNFYIVPGDKSREELFKLAEGGIFVTGMKGFHAGANVVSGDFSIESEGFMIENGKKGKPIKSFTVSGNFFEMLKNISEIGDTIEDLDPATSRIRCPDVLLPDVPVAGK